MNIDNESELLQSTGNNGQKRNPTVCLMPTKVSSYAPSFNPIKERSMPLITCRKVLAFFALVATFSLTACVGLSEGVVGHTMTWKEEVLLHDGRIAIAERRYNLGGYPTLDSTDRSVINETTTFTLPGTEQRITWQSDFRDSVPEPNSLNLLLFGVVNGVPYLATHPAGCIAYNKWQRPNPFYVVFRYERGEWKRISLGEFPVELSKTNVIIGGPIPKLLKPFYPVKEVNAENYYLEPKYKTILTKAIEDPVGRCGEMISDGKGGWIGIGWFRDQPTREACLSYCIREKVGAKNCPCETLFKDAE